MKSGCEIGKGISSIAYIVMGQQDGWPGSGWYNNYIEECYLKAECDTQAASDIAEENLKIRLLSYQANKPAAAEFIKQKLLTQWNKPTYEAFWVNTSFTPEILDQETGMPVEGSLAKEVFFGALSGKLFDFMDRYQFIIYGMTTIGATGLLLRRKIEELLLPVAIFGGFLFSIL